ncbi:MAG: aminopeptidase P family protein [Gemmatimonadales bacterium]
MADFRPARAAALRAACSASGVDALLVTHLPNIRWLTGFSGSAALVVVSPAAVTLITDFRYATQAPHEVGAAAEVIVDRRNVWDRLARVLAKEAPDTLGIEAAVVTVREAERISAITSARVFPLTDTVERLRQVKDESEVAAIRAAGALALEALAEVLPTVRVGEREIDVAARLESALRRRGSEWHPFPTIVASGPRSALPHAGTSERVIGRGEFLLIDFGAQLEGYCADITRTVVVGAKADERQRTVYDLVEDAQRRAREGVRAGMSGSEADALARELIAARGYGEAFGHSLGHGLGLEVHEAPRLAQTADGLLPVGAVVTVEPGIYLPGWGGVRLEDDVWLSAGGPVLLTDGRTELIELEA